MPATNAEIQNLSLTQHAAYEVTIPDGVQAVQIQCRDATDLRIGLTSLSVDTNAPAGPYYSIKSGTVFRENALYFASAKKLYLATAGANKVAEVLFFS